MLIPNIIYNLINRENEDGRTITQLSPLLYDAKEKTMKYLLIAALFVLSAVVAGDTDKTKAEIKFLIDHVKNSSFIFIRNGKEHSAEDAYNHMMKKYKFFKDEIDTADKFIELTLTKSTMTGEHYKIKLPDSKVVLSQDYFLEKLKSFRTGY